VWRNGRRPGLKIPCPRGVRVRVPPLAPNFRVHVKKEKAVIDKILSIVKFDLNNGPYIIGSYVTHQLAQLHDSVAWKPNDIDIICRTEEQMFSLKETLCPVASYYNEKERPVVSQMFGVHPLQMIWVIDGITVTASIRDHAATEQIKTADYTISAAATDGNLYIASSQSLLDIQNGILRKLSFDMNEKCVGAEATAWVLEKYNSYVDRGFIDKDQVILNELNTLVA